VKILQFDYSQAQNIPEEQLRITLNIKPEDMKYLTEVKYGCKWFSHDEDVLRDENAVSNVSAVYSAVGLTIPQEFVSLAIRTHRHHAEACSAYGKITLVINQDAIMSDQLVIFNGDVKGLGLKIKGIPVREHHEWIETHTLLEPIPEIISALNRLEDRKKTGKENPRMYGNYFEARLFRALVLQDIELIYIPKGYTNIIESVQLLCPDVQILPVEKEAPDILKNLGFT